MSHVQVYCRPRPLLGDERRGPRSFLRRSDTVLEYTDTNPKKPKTTAFEFDHIFEETATQAEVRAPPAFR